MIINDNGLIQYAPEDEQRETIFCDGCGDEIENEIEAQDYTNDGTFTGCYFCEDCKKEN